jgi:cation:H+ antiporter
MRRWQVRILVALLVALPSLVLRIGGIHLDPLPSVAIYGAAVVAAAFILAWAAEAAEADISAGLAVALLALIAVLPEYGVDLYFAWASGSRPEYAQYAAANMTGSNRLLIGIGWPLVVFVFMLGARRRGAGFREIVLDDHRRVELAFLAVAGVFAFVVPLTGQLSLAMAVVLLALFAYYMSKVAGEERQEAEFLGIAAHLAALPQRRRRVTVSLLFAAAAAFVVSAAQPFADALVQTGQRFGIDEFLLVQWLAPLASESPELIVAMLFAYKGKSDRAFGTLLSSKVNQWTLLVGSIPVAHYLGGGGFALDLDARQTEEFILTAAQTILGFAVIANLRFSFREALLLLGLFALQFPFPQTEVRLAFSVAYLVVATILLVRERRDLPPILRQLLPRRVRPERKVRS